MKTQTHPLHDEGDVAQEEAKRKKNRRRSQNESRKGKRSSRTIEMNKEKSIG